MYFIIRNDMEVLPEYSSGMYNVDLPLLWSDN